jgi:hypothetical protein
MELLESLGPMLHHLWREGGPDQEEGTGEWSPRTGSFSLKGIVSRDSLFRRLGGQLRRPGAQ